MVVIFQGATDSAALAIFPARAFYQLVHFPMTAHTGDVFRLDCWVVVICKQLIHFFSLARSDSFSVRNPPIFSLLMASVAACQRFIFSSEIWKPFSCFRRGLDSKPNSICNFTFPPSVLRGWRGLAIFPASSALFLGPCNYCTKWIARDAWCWLATR